MAISQETEKNNLQDDAEFQQLLKEHHHLDVRVTELSSRHHLSNEDAVEEVTLKKRKLFLKDQMERILRDQHKREHFTTA